MKPNLITGEISDDLVMSELARIGSAISPIPTSDARMAYSRDLLLWVTSGGDEITRSRRFTAIKQVFSNWVRDNRDPQQPFATIENAEKILAFLNTDLRTDGRSE